MFELFPQQAASAHLLLAALETYGSALDSSDTGTGKTLKAVEVARLRESKRTVVVCPKAVVATWQDAFQAQGAPVSGVVNYEKLRTGNHGWIARNRKKIVWQEPLPDLVIFDEVHKCKGHATLNANLLTSARMRGIPLLMLSATAAEDPTEMRALGFALGLHGLRDFYDWAKKWGCGFDAFNQLKFPGKFVDRIKTLEKLRGYLYPARGHRVTRDDMGEFFSITSISTSPVSFGDEKRIQRIYTQMQSYLQDLESAKEKDTGGAGLTAILRARQEVELLKVPTFCEMAKDYLDQGYSVPIFVNFSQTMDAIAEWLETKGIGSVCIRGGQSDAVRARAISEFQSNLCRVILVNIQAGGVGLSLHDLGGGAPRVSLISPTWSAKDLIQVLGRTDRAGALTDTVQIILFARGTVEEAVVHAATQKRENLETLHMKTPNIDKMMEAAEALDDAPLTKAQVGAAEEELKKVGGALIPGAGFMVVGGAGEHAKYNPSSQKYRRVCPHYKNRDNEDANEGAERGTRIHLACETGDLSVCADDRERDMACMMLNYVEELVPLLGVDGESYDERRFQIDLGDGERTFGTCDKFVLNKDRTRALAVDYKTGYTPIDDASENDQAECYVIGGFQEEPDVMEIDFYFLIPAQGEVSHHRFYRSDLPRLRARQLAVVRRAQAAERGELEDYNPQPDVCDFCGNVGRCKAWTNLALGIAEKYSDKGFEVDLDQLHGSEVDDATVLARGLRALPVLANWIDAWRKRCQDMVESGVELPGFKSSYVKGRRTINNFLAAVKVAEKYGVVAEDLYAVAKLPLSDVIEAVREKAPHGKKGNHESGLCLDLEAADLLDGGKPTLRLSPIRGTKP